MCQTFTIFKKEFKSYFVSPIAYIVIFVFLLAAGFFFFRDFFIYKQADLRLFFMRLPFIFSLIVPAITMRLFSEEMNVGSYETLMTMPVTVNDVIFGKFIAATAFLAVMLVPTLSYPVFVGFLGRLEWGAVAGGYTGAILLGASFAAIGVFTSSLTRNQIIALIIGIAICSTLAILNEMLIFIPGKIVSVLEYVSAGFHFQNISKGIIDTRDILYFVSLIFVSLYGANLVMQRKN